MLLLVSFTLDDRNSGKQSLDISCIIVRKGAKQIIKFVSSLTQCCLIKWNHYLYTDLHVL